MLTQLFRFVGGPLQLRPSLQGEFSKSHTQSTIMYKYFERQLMYQ